MVNRLVGYYIGVSFINQAMLFSLFPLLFFDWFFARILYVALANNCIHGLYLLF